MFNYIRHMMVFFCIVDTGSISGAAAKLNLSKSVVSQRLKDLERELGVTLLHRSTRKQALTTAGKNFYMQCEVINKTAKQAWDEARGTHESVIGSIRITTPNALVEPFVGPSVGELLQQYEGVHATLLTDDTQVNLIGENVDLAIRVGKMPVSDYKQRKLGHFRDVLCASPEYLDRHGITEKQLMSIRDSYQPFDYIANSWQGKHIVHKFTHKKTNNVVRLSFRANNFCNSLSAVVALARTGCGFAYIPDFVFMRYKYANELTEVLPNYYGEIAPIYAVHAFSKTPPKLVSLTIDAIKNKITDSMNA